MISSSTTTPFTSTFAPIPRVTSEFWTVDRLHPSEPGHRWLAHRFAGELDVRGSPSPILSYMVCDRPDQTVLCSSMQVFHWARVSSGL